MTISISGTVYSDEGVTPDLSGLTINVSVNGAASSGSGLSSGSDGTYSIAGITAAAAAVITVYLQGNLQVGVTVTISNGANIAGIDIYEDHLVLRHEQGTGISWTNVNTSDNNGATGLSAIYVATTNSATTIAAGKTLYVPLGFKTTGVVSLTAGGNVTYNGDRLVGNMNMTLTGTGSQKLTPPPSGLGAGTLTVNCTTGTYALQGNLSASGPILTSGTLSLNGFNFTYTGSWQQTGGALVGGTGTVTFTGLTGTTFTGNTAFTNYAAVVTNGSTMTFTAGTTQTFTGSLTLTGAVGTLLPLASSSPGTQYTIVAPATQSLSYLNVTDCNNTGKKAQAGLTSVDGGNNVNWNFGAAVTASDGKAF